jgi:hypothetical protein
MCLNDLSVYGCCGPFRSDVSPLDIRRFKRGFIGVALTVQRPVKLHPFHALFDRLKHDALEYEIQLCCPTNMWSPLALVFAWFAGCGIRNLAHGAVSERLCTAKDSANNTIFTCCDASTQDCSLSSTSVFAIGGCCYSCAVSLVANECLGEQANQCSCFRTGTLRAFLDASMA